MAVTVNSDGLIVRFGRDQGLRGSKAAVTTSTTKRNELVLLVDLEGAARTTFSMDNDNDGDLDGFGGLDTPIPANAMILRQDTIQLEAPAGGTNFTVGTFEEDGTEIDADGIRLADGSDGALVGTQVTQNSFVGVTTTGTYTAGKFKVIIEYIIS